MSAHVVSGARTLLGPCVATPVVVVESVRPGDPTHLHPDEAAVVAGARAPRRAEFAAVRECAREALTRLGVPPAPILPQGSGPMWAARAPRWPDGVVGSMTHVAGYAAAVVAPAALVASVGVDAEPNTPLPDDVREYVTLPDERAALGCLAAADGAVAWDRLLFSVKEAVFKAWFPLTGRWLGFGQCRVELDVTGGCRAHLLADLPPDGRVPGVLAGRWRRASPGGTELLAAAVVLPCRGR